MLLDHWPLPGLTVRVGRLELRLPNDDELGELADLAAQGIHKPGEQPFLQPSTDRATTALDVIQRSWRLRGLWKADDWALGLVVFENGHPVGMQSVRGHHQWP